MKSIIIFFLVNLVFSRILEEKEKKKAGFFSIELPYPLNELEPVISEKTVDFHFNKHHKGYLNKLNDKVRKTLKLGEMTIKELIISSEIGSPINNLAGQIFNHNLFWKNFQKPSIKEENNPKTGTNILKYIESSFYSFGEFKNEFSNKAKSLFGSGWVFLSYNPTKDILEIGEYKNAENPIKEGLIPLLTFDVWEHSYYLDYQNGRATYVDSLWKLINWKEIERSFLKCLGLDSIEL